MAIIGALYCIIIRMRNIDEYKNGMTVYGKITGIKPYGAFVGFDNGVTGLIHISELSNGFVRNVSNFVNVGDYALLKVIDVDRENKQLRLSFKALSQNSRKHLRRVKFLGLPENEIGFGSLADMMPKWVKEKIND